ncbi:hypothetical protein K438DRAFT_2135551 [Mycena galopus ATCC 62051]|nr:hypothetical protein K438DRAFT_2135551 [Mycena galopus ATCC 62051]
MSPNPQFNIIRRQKALGDRARLRDIENGRKFEVGWKTDFEASWKTDSHQWEDLRALLDPANRQKLAYARSEISKQARGTSITGGLVTYEEMHVRQRAIAHNPASNRMRNPTPQCYGTQFAYATVCRVSSRQVSMTERPIFPHPKLGLLCPNEQLKKVHDGPGGLQPSLESNEEAHKLPLIAQSFSLDNFNSNTHHRANAPFAYKA